MPTGKYKRKKRGNYRDPIKGFFDKLEKTDYCWNWKAGIDRDGYGIYSPYRVKMRAHRYSYELFIGEIPKGLTIDHLCRNRGCVNPNHLEAVSSKENILRGNGLASINSKKTHCKYGHPLSGKNLYIVKKTGGRVCRKCDRRRGREYAERKKQNITAE